MKDMFEKVQAAATLDNAKHYSTSTNKYDFCRRLLGIQYTNRFYDGVVADLERQFADLLEEEERAAYRDRANRVSKTAVLRSILAAKKHGYLLAAVWDGEETAWSHARAKAAAQEARGEIIPAAMVDSVCRGDILDAATAACSCNLIFRKPGGDKKARLVLAWEWANLQVYGKTASERYAEALVDGSAPLELHPLLDEVMREAGAYQ